MDSHTHTYTHCIIDFIHEHTYVTSYMHLIVAIAFVSDGIFTGSCEVPQLIFLHTSEIRALNILP